MAGLNTLENMYSKTKRQTNVTFGNDLIGKGFEKIFETGFYLGMVAYSEFMEEISQLPLGDGLKEIENINKELKKQFNED